MPVPDVILNTDNVSISRPIDQMSGGDTNNKVVHNDLRAHVRVQSRFIREEAGGVAERILVTKMLFQPFDREGFTLDIQSGDFVRFPDYRGILQERLVTMVDPVSVNGRLDHIVVEAEEP